MKKLSKIALLRSLTIITLIALPLLGTDCEDIINQISQNPCSGTSTISGDWTLIYNAGTLNDICPGERVVLPSNTGGTAQLTCPGGSTLSRNYTLTGSTLEYTQTGAEYTVDFTENCEMVLSGINNGRILYYSTTPTADKHKNTETKPNDVNSNSSEIKK